MFMAQPLATRLRPAELEDIVGQSHLLSPGCALRKIIDSDKLSSAIFYGPPGTGKTTLAEVIARKTNSPFRKFNATSATVAAIRKEGEAATIENPIVMFVDEIHRFSKTQSDVLLPYVEEGLIILIGATTENPFHSLTPALLSRSQIFNFEHLTEKDLVKLVVRTVEHFRENRDISIDPDAVRHLISICCGDARKLINTLELAIESSEGVVTKAIVEELAPSKYLVFGKDDHFDLASAFQGSIQASDPDAAIYWLAKWLESGEDPRYIARRLMVSASEDAAGNPEAAMVAHSAYVAACEVGRPECDIVMAHATILTATAPRNKSAANAIWAAVEDVKKGRNIEVPKEMKDSHYAGAKELGNGAYHDGMNQDAYVGIGKRYYFPK
jgi:putative ATPase